MKLLTTTQNKHLVSGLSEAVKDFEHLGTVLFAGRNVVKVLDIQGKRVNVKRFRTPNVINQLVYRFLRKSKAQRSFEYAQRLEKHHIGTPAPIAYAELYTAWGLGFSYYFSEQVDCDFTFRALITDDTIPDREEILKQYTQFVYQMHEQNIYFLDNSPGNTLITKNGDRYDFALVDLNRMKFYDIPYADRLKNFERLAPVKWIYDVMGAEYARLAGTNAEEAVTQMWLFTERFQEKFHRKRALKKKVKSFFGLK